MKEAYGGVTNLYLFMFFFVIYVCFLAIALNFAKTYRVKNYVIDVLEQNQFDGNLNNANSIKDKLDAYFNWVPYKGNDDVAVNYCSNYNQDVGSAKCMSYNGISIISKGTDASPYYQVVAFFTVEFPLFSINGLSVPISGETMIINQPS